MQEKINNKIFQIQDATKLDLLENIRELDFEQRCVIEYKENISYTDVELLVRKLAKISQYKVSLTYGDVGISISKENLKNKKYTEYNRAFVVVEEGQYEKNIVKIFPKSYLSMLFHWGYCD